MNTILKKTISFTLSFSVAMTTIFGSITGYYKNKSDNITIVSATDNTPVLSYSAHVQSKGWLKPVGEGKLAGTTGQSKRLEAFKINSPRIQYMAYSSKTGWQGWKTNNQIAGTIGQSLPIEAIRIMFNNQEDNKHYSICYRVHMQGLGWSAWKLNGAYAGTLRESRRIEALEIRIIDRLSFYGMEGTIINTGKDDVYAYNNASYKSTVRFCLKKNYPYKILSYFEGWYFIIDGFSIGFVDASKVEVNTTKDFLLAFGENDTLKLIYKVSK